MKSKASLALVEQCIILLIFALAAALCLKTFVWADRMGNYIDARDMAVVCAQNAAEQLKAARGAQLAQGDWVICYDENWNPVSQPHTYVLTAMRWPDLPEDAGLGRSVIFVETAQGEVLFKLPANWQEVIGP